jgi:UDP-glucose 4-epimerase
MSIDVRSAPPQSDGCERLELDLTSPEARAAIVRFRPERVFHLAGASLIPYCNAHPREAFESNVLGTASLLHAVRRTPPATLVFASSAAVYGYGERLHERLPAGASDVYGISKLLAERLVRLFHEEVPDVRCRVARLFSPYGKNDSPSRLLPRVVEAHRRGTALSLGNLWPKRDFIHVADALDGLLRLDPTGPAFDIVNIGSGVGTNVEALVHLVSELTGRTVPVDESPELVRSDDGHRVADNSKLVAAYGWQPRYDLRTGLATVLE